MIVETVINHTHQHIKHISNCMRFNWTEVS